MSGEIGQNPIDCLCLSVINNTLGSPNHYFIYVGRDRATNVRNASTSGIYRWYLSGRDRAEPCIMWMALDKSLTLGNLKASFYDCSRLIEIFSHIVLFGYVG